jgi:hypothetical protein
MTEDKVRKMRELDLLGYDSRLLADEFKVGYAMVRLIVTGKAWKHVEAGRRS